MRSDTPGQFPSDMPPMPAVGDPYAGGAIAPTIVAPPPPPPTAAGASTGGSGGLAITGLVFAIIAMLLPVFALFTAFARLSGLAGLLLLAAIPIAIIGVVLSAVGRSSARQRGSASAGLTLGIVALVLSVGVLLFALAMLRGGALGPRQFRRPPRRFVPQGALYRAAPSTESTARLNLWN